MDAATALTGFDIVGAWVSIFLTLAILSFLYADNPVYKLAEHIFLGVSIGVGLIEVYHGVFRPNLIDKLAQGNLLSLVPLAMCAMLFARTFSKKLGWLARIPIAFIVAAYAGVKLTGEANANLMTQVAQSMPDLSALWAEHGLWDWSADGAGVLSGILLVAGLCACLLHFYFSARHGPTMRVISRFGVLVLMLSFGASFGYTVMGRISLAIGRAQELLGLLRPTAEVEVIHPQLATVVCGIVIIGFLVAWRMRGGGSDEAGA
ncbi:MAG: hypothetical protein D6798_16825 [Deltaproteobacteria bacterium]|nr:MAG: hypothetical protein D6798_16825 [Deltaproteobacteria bacterium]